MLSVNAEAMKLVRRIIESSEALGVRVSRLDNGTTLIDMGHRAPGSWEAGRLYTLVALGGLADVRFETFRLDGVPLPAVRIMVDRPMEACVASQMSGWRLAAEADAPLVSGPARALNQNPDRYFEPIKYRDHYHEGVVTIQTGKAVTQAWADDIARSCQLEPEQLYILWADHSALATAIQVPARIVEQTLHRLAAEGFDITSVRHALGICVVPPLVDDELQAFGRINDALLYGGESFLFADAEDETIGSLVHKVVSSVSSAYGRPFSEIYEEAGRDWHAIPMNLNSPAVVHITNLRSGRTFSAGAINFDVLRRSFFGVA